MLYPMINIDNTLKCFPNFVFLPLAVEIMHEEIYNSI